MSRTLVTIKQLGQPDGRVDVLRCGWRPSCRGTAALLLRSHIYGVRAEHGHSDDYWAITRTQSMRCLNCVAVLRIRWSSLS